jgi:phosphatidylglycerol:prolipoprotein diacylglycerol transferase
MHPLLLDFGTLDLGPFEIPLRLPSYGTAMLVGVVLGWLIVRRLGRRVEPRLPWADFYVGLILSGLVGAKVLWGLVELPRLLAGELPWRAVVFAGGVWLGAVLGGLVFCLVFFHGRDLAAGRALNVVFTGLPLAHVVGRIGCLLAGCCYGAACAKPWAITYTSELAARFAGTPLGVPLHPSPLYEAAAELFNFLVCVSLWRRGEPAPWAVVFTWAALYGAERFVLELFRGDFRGAWLGLSTSQWLTAAMVVAALSWFSIRRLRSGRDGRLGAPPGSN